jgi:CubicO group peptidase (beta-lactamase class C family)
MQKKPDYQSAATYSEQRRGHAVLVMREGKTVFETYQNGWSRDRPHILASGTKSFSGVMAACAIEDGFISSWDELLAETLTEWKSDPMKRKITLRHLLSLTGGLDAGSNGRVPTYADAIQFPAKHDPGIRFQYGPVPYQTFGEFLRRKLLRRRQDPLAYLTERILNPIGLKVGLWRRGIDRNPQLPSGAFLTATEWVKFGELLRQEGVWNGKRLVSFDTVRPCFVGSKANPKYGLTFWLGPSSAQGKFYMAAGAGKQRLYVIPPAKMVIVRFGDNAPFRDDEFLGYLLPEKSKIGEIDSTE